MKYTVTILKLAEKFIVKLPKPEKERVLKAVGGKGQLKYNGRPIRNTSDFLT